MQRRRQVSVTGNGKRFEKVSGKLKYFMKLNFSGNVCREFETKSVESLKCRVSDEK